MSHEEKQDDRAKLYKMIEKVKIAMLTTIEPDGSLHTRPMGNQEADEKGDLWFFAEKGSSIETNITANPTLGLGYSNPSDDNYVAVSGKGYLVYDQATIDEKWTADLKAWFPDGKTDPKIVLLRVEPDRGEFWDTRSSTLTTVVGFIKASLGGGPPDEMTDQAKVQL